MWYLIFMTLLKLIGPYVIEMLIDWIWGEITGTVNGPAPELVKKQPKAAKAIRRMLKDEATRRYRIEVMRKAIADAKRTSYPVV